MSRNQGKYLMSRSSIASNTIRVRMRTRKPVMHFATIEAFSSRDFEMFWKLELGIFGFLLIGLSVWMLSEDWARYVVVVCGRSGSARDDPQGCFCEPTVSRFGQVC